MRQIIYVMLSSLCVSILRTLTEHPHRQLSHGVGTSKTAGHKGKLNMWSQELSRKTAIELAVWAVEPCCWQQRYSLASSPIQQRKLCENLPTLSFQTDGIWTAVASAALTTRHQTMTTYNGRSCVIPRLFADQYLLLSVYSMRSSFHLE